MDAKDASAMTEASGLTDEQEEVGRAYDARSGTSRDFAIRWAERLRRVTVKAPLRSLLAAFLLGSWVARRR